MTSQLYVTGHLWCPTEGDLDALLVRDGRIVATGAAARDQVRDTPDAEVVEISEGVLIPAFADGHAHPLFGGLEAEGPQIRVQDSIAGIVAEVRRWAQEHPDAPWVTGA